MSILALNMVRNSPKTPEKLASLTKAPNPSKFSVLTRPGSRCTFDVVRKGSHEHKVKDSSWNGNIHCAVVYPGSTWPLRLACVRMCACAQTGWGLYQQSPQSPTSAFHFGPPSASVIAGHSEGSMCRHITLPPHRMIGEKRRPVLFVGIYYYVSRSC
jgi:hypothetical protein